MSEDDSRDGVGAGLELVLLPDDDELPDDDGTCAGAGEWLVPDDGSRGVAEAGCIGLADGGGNETGDELDFEAPPLPPILPEVEEVELLGGCGAEIAVDDGSKCRGAANCALCGASWELGGSARDGRFELEAGFGAHCGADCRDDEFESDDPAEPWLLGARLLTGVSGNPDGVDDSSWVLRILVDLGNSWKMASETQCFLVSW